MHEKPSVAVVILSWNGKDFLKKFIPPLLKTTYSNVAYYVADNASTDDSVEFMQQNFPEVNIIQVPTNEGFAKGYNTALKQVNADYYVLLNQDVEVTPGWIEPVIDLMEKEPKVAACQPKLKAFHQKSDFEYAGAAGGFIDCNGYIFCRGRFFQTTEKDHGQYERETEIFWATGACMFIRAKLFHAFEGFDPDFFAHMEEIDLCWRLKRAGYAVKYCPGSTAYHVGGGSLPHGNPRKTYLNFRNNLTMIVKNLSSDVIYFRLIKRLILDIISAYKTLLSGNVRDYIAIAKAHLYFFAHFSFILEKRKHAAALVAKNKVADQPNLTGFYRGSIIWDYFARKRKSFEELPKEHFL